MRAIDATPKRGGGRIKGEKREVLIPKRPNPGRTNMLQEKDCQPVTDQDKRVP